MTGYDYDRQGNLTKVTDARNYATEYHYDTLGRLTLEKPPQADLGLSAYGWKYGYADGVDDTLTTVSKPDDVTGTTVNYIDVEYVYDDLARLTQVKADGSQYSSYGATSTAIRCRTGC